ncbi:unnamed protein product [Onchocerca flexuosa]|uniref:Secreted protein n=1 Tax=Onchocerca flexuosa TaxID=387005 RepID=A0A183HUJ1_9BILA|nr:unnamed protein product [Onchocerca flexuosa]
MVLKMMMMMMVIVTLYLNQFLHVVVRELDSLRQLNITSMMMMMMIFLNCLIVHHRHTE